MHFTKLIAAAACCFSLGLATQVDKATYQKSIAPSVIQHITNFRTENAATLEPAQSAYIAKILQYVSVADFSDLDAVEREAHELFDKDIANYLLAGKDKELQTRNLLTRADPACACATDSDYCFNSKECKETSGCKDIADSCGTFQTFDCNGLCY
ncbi:hypothetical protein FQN54_001831 [Arachnomyces sp. PD_36]|nr:hypothetical protein FQN54_001831 [Arachnomyces sp. PD_36]